MGTDGQGDASEIQGLRRGMNDLVAIVSLSAVWVREDTSVVAASLLDALMPMLNLDLAYLRLSDSTGASPREWARYRHGAARQTTPGELGRWLEPYLVSGPEGAGVRIDNPLDQGTISIAFGQGLSDGVCAFAAGSTRPDFPTDFERLALRVAVNQAAIALHEARRVTELQNAAQELGRRIAERTAELTAALLTIQRVAVERERGEHALAETESRLHQLAEAIPEIIWIAALEPDERIVYASPSFERVWGLPIEELHRNPGKWSEAIHPEDRAHVVRSYTRWISGEQPSYEEEFRVVRPDGSVRWVHEHGVLSVDGLGKPIGASGISTDITDRKEAQQVLESALEEIRALKDRLQQENLALREEVEKTSMFEEIVGISAPLRAVLSQIALVAPSDSTVLITGETGTGKELVARAIHKLSRRSNHALISVNCAAIPPSLIASELFGHEKGAFTGAVQRRQGRFELAAGGTIFLDEVADLPAETQVALLRVLQEHEFERVGGARPIRVDVRVMAASNRDLEVAVARGHFRADLFYRLNVFPLVVPALRDRSEDIPVLVEYFMHRYARRAGKKVRGINKSSLELLRSYEWPGNVRELQNVIERAVILCEGETLSVDQTWLRRHAGEDDNADRVAGRLATSHLREIIERALADSRGRVSGPQGAAAILGIPRSTLESRIRSLRISKYRFKSQ